MPTLSNYVRVYAPIGVLVIALIIILIVPNNFNKNFDSNENRSIIKNLEDSNINIEIFQDSKCLKFETIHQDNNYTSAINYFTEEIIKLGFTHKNIFQVNKLEEGSGIIFVSIINTSGNGMDYCEKLNETFKKKNSEFDCRVARNNETTLSLTNALRFTNNNLEARYRVSC